MKRYIYIILSFDRNAWGIVTSLKALRQAVKDYPNISYRRYELTAYNEGTKVTYGWDYHTLWSVSEVFQPKNFPKILKDI